MTPSRLLRLLEYPRLYAEAVRLRRRATQLSDNAGFEDELRIAEAVGITQKPDEIRRLCELVRAERPRTVLEIGLDQGGTLFLWTRVATDDAHLISLDTRSLGPLGSLSPFAIGRRGLARGHQRVDLLAPADSHRVETLRRVQALLAGRSVDFLFVDGDHAYEGVKRDFDMYAPLVRAGGIVAFHDVSSAATPDTEGTARFWTEFARGREVEEFVAPGLPGFGIGVFRIPA